MAEALTSRTLSHILVCNAGYADTADFLALGGLFTTHVTSNFVTQGAARIQRNPGAISKLRPLIRMAYVDGPKA